MRPAILVGILNVTPDSFSDGGHYLEPESAIQHAQALLEDGADIVEVGGESTRPGSTPVADEAEWGRIRPVIAAIAPKVKVSIDTYKASVADRALKMGAAIINDVSALRADTDMARVIADHGAQVVLMYSKEKSLPHVTEREPRYTDLVGSIRDFLEERVAFAEQHGIKRSQIIIDPGLGRFLGKDPSYSWTVLRELPRLAELQLPILIGTSRKGFLGVSNTPMHDRDAVSQLTALGAYLNGATYLRTHNVLLAKHFLDAWKRMGLERVGFS